ncbi:MAG: ComEC/Rec2 family competence protein [Candidatus Omnitrophota bacterium]|nr:ComEC/Rec2 family competence protein [Candidatus Omnitrophota bacterium]
MNLPLALLTIFYCLGIILANFIGFNFWAVMVAAIGIFIATILLREKIFIFSALILFLALFVGALNLNNFRILPQCHISNYIYYKDNSIYGLSGSIDSEPELKDNHTQFIFSAREIQKNKLKWLCCGKVLVRLDFTSKLNYGDNLMLIGNLKRPYNFNSVAAGYKDFLGRQGIYLIMHVQDMRQLIRLKGNSGFKLISSSFWLRAKMEAVISRYLTDLPASILSAMVLGQKRGIPWLINSSFVKSGTVHILVVSGFNVGIVAFIINLLFKILRFSRKARIILSIIFLLIYCLITGASNPVVRATVMGLIFLSAYLFKREADIYNSLVISALLILIINPGQLFDIGFQLSFASVLAIVYLYPKLAALIHLEAYVNKIWKFICQGCLVSFSAWLGTLGIIAFNFGIIVPVTVLANILIVPLATVITLCGFILLLSGLLNPSLASLISAPTSMLINLLLNINTAIIRLPFAYFYL